MSEGIDVDTAGYFESGRGPFTVARSAMARAEARAFDAEQRVEIDVARTVELRRKLQDATRALKLADERAHAADERAHVSLERTKQLQAEVDARRATVSELHQDAGNREGQDMVRQRAPHGRKLDPLVAEYLELDRLFDGTLKPNGRRTDLAALVRRVADGNGPHGGDAHPTLEDGAIAI